MKRYLKVFLVAAALLFAMPVFAQLTVPEIPYDSAPDFLNTGDSPSWVKRSAWPRIPQGTSLCIRAPVRPT